MMRRIGWLAAALSFSVAAGTPVALTPAQQQAILDEGTTFGQGALSVGAGTINSAGGAAGVPGYNATPSGQAPGAAGLFSPATAKKAGCDGYVAPAGAGQLANQMDCDAVDFLAKNPNPKSAYPIDPNTDPTIQAGRAVLLSARDGTAFQPGGVAAGFGVATTQTGTGCATTTTTSPGTTTTSSCYIAATLSTQTCDKTLNCAVTQPAPVPATPSYSCPSGSVLIGTQCQPYAYAASVNYSCSAGSTLSGSTCQPAPTTATLSYSCVSGVLSGTQCITPVPGATLTYSCPQGGTLSGSTCVGTTTTATLTYTCPSGSTLVNGNQCQAPSYQPAGVPATAYTCTPTTTRFLNNYGGNGSLCAAPCPTGTTLNSHLVTENYTSGSACVPTNANICPPGTTIFTAIDDIYWMGIPACTPSQSPAYTCPSGYTLSGTTCYPPEVTPPPTAASSGYACPTGSTLTGTSCQTNSYAATVSASCSIGGQGQYSGVWYAINAGGYVPAFGVTVSISGSTWSYSSTSQVCSTTNATVNHNWPGGYWGGGTYYCLGYIAAGYYPPTPVSCVEPVTTCSNVTTTIGGAYQANPPTTSSSCIASTTATTISYSCPTNTTLSGSNCYPPPVGATVVYTCPSGATLTGTSCQPPSTTAAVTYSCGRGMVLSGSTCIPAAVTTCTWTDNCIALQALTQ